MKKLALMETTPSKWPPRTLAEFKYDEDGNENTAGLAELAIIEARLKQRMSQAASSPTWHPSVFLLKRDKPDGKLLPQWPAPKPKRIRSRASVTPAYIPADPAPVHVPRMPVVDVQIERLPEPKPVVYLTPEEETLMMAYAANFLDQRGRFATLELITQYVNYRIAMEDARERVGKIRRGELIVMKGRSTDIHVFNTYETFERTKPYTIISTLCRSAIAAGESLIWYLQAGIDQLVAMD